MKNVLSAGVLALGLAMAGTAGAEVYFEDTFDGEEPAEGWSIRNENLDAYLVEGGVLTMLAPDKQAYGIEASENVFVLDMPVPKGDWTMTARFSMVPQAFGEGIGIGIGTDKDKGLYAEYYFHTDNYARTIAYVQARKVAKGETTRFWRDLFYFEDRDLEVRSTRYTDQVGAVELRLQKRGRKYEAAARLEPVQPGADGAPSGEWMTVQKLTSLRAPGDNFVLFFGSNSSGYVPEGGEGLIEIDWVRIETP